jgi:hypothetical protein
MPAPAPSHDDLQVLRRPGHPHGVRVLEVLGTRRREPQVADEGALVVHPIMDLLPALILVPALPAEQLSVVRHEHQHECPGMWALLLASLVQLSMIMSIKSLAFVLRKSMMSCGVSAFSSSQIPHGLQAWCSCRYEPQPSAQHHQYDVQSADELDKMPHVKRYNDYPHASHQGSNRPDKR